MFSSSKSSIFAQMSKPHDRNVLVAASPNKSTKSKKDDDACKPARSLTITEAHNGFQLKGPNWEDKGAVCESKKSLLAAVDAAFPDEPGKGAEKKDAAKEKTDE